VTGRDTSDRIARIGATARGDVQGVGFRWFIVREAAQLGLVGWVANLPDGTVRLEAEGERRALDRLVALVRRGPAGADVEGVATSELRPLGTESAFSVRALGHRGD